MRFKVHFNNQDAEIDVIRQGDRLIVTHAGRAFDARLIYTDGPHFVLEVEEEGPNGFVGRKRIRAAGFRKGNHRQLWANGRMISYQRLQEGAAAPMDLQSTSLAASIPAVVSEILVNLGDRVKNGDKLILLESMKMILPIQAPYNGVVKAVHCSPGEAVQPGVQLIELKPDSEQEV